jgi:hypothetical protein
MEGEPEPELKERPLKSFARSAEFWGRATAIYAGYKASQAHAVALRVLGWDEERIKTEHWGRQHTKAAAQLHGLCIDLRGFYLKVFMQRTGCEFDLCGRAAVTIKCVPALCGWAWSRLGPPAGCAWSNRNDCW